MTDRTATLRREATGFGASSDSLGHLESGQAPHGRLGGNLLANGVNLFGTALATLWFTPYLTRKLGMSGYGLVALANSILPYLALSTVILNSAVQRHITIYLERGEEQRASRIFNTCVCGTLALAVLLLPLAALLIGRSGSLFVAPGHGLDLKILLSCIYFVFVFIALGIPFQSAAVSRNRLDISNAISLGYTLTRVGVVVLIFHFATAKIWHVGVGLVAAAVLSMVATVIAWRILTPQMRLSPRFVDRSALSELISPGAWSTIDALGSILYLNTELIVVNRMLGPEAGGHYAAALQWPLIIRGAIFAVSPVFLPPMLYLFARRDMAGLGRFCRLATRGLGLAVAVPIGLVCGLSRPLLGVWLGSKAVALAPLLVLMTAHLSVNLCVHPLIGMQLAANKLRAPAIVALILGVANLGIAVWLTGPMGWGLYGVAAAGVITLTLRMLLFSPLYAARTLGISSLPIYREVCLVGGVTLALAGSGWLFSSWVALTSWFAIILAACALCAIWALAALPLVMSKAGKEKICSLVIALQDGGAIE
jgi:membrane protein EpsK